MKNHILGFVLGLEKLCWADEAVKTGTLGTEEMLAEVENHIMGFVLG